MRIYIVAEQYGEMGGSERVQLALRETFPEAVTIAPVFEGEAESRGPAPDRLVPIPGRRRRHLTPLYARRLAREPIEPPAVVISIATHGWSLGVVVPPGARHLCYSNGVPRSLYGQSDLYLRDQPRAARALIRAGQPALRAYERRLMRRADRLLTNSRFSAGMIERVHGRAAEIVPPPVRTNVFTPGRRERTHFLVVARLSPQKRLEEVVEAFRGSSERLVVAGEGPLAGRLKASAPPNVEFTGFVDDARLAELYRTSHAAICPSVEDFGIAVGEAQAAGTPVVVRSEGGASEICRRPDTGIVIASAEPAAIAAAVRQVRERCWDLDACRQAALRFDEAVFSSEMARVVEEEAALVSRPGELSPHLSSAPAA